MPKYGQVKYGQDFYGDREPDTTLTASIRIRQYARAKLRGFFVGIWRVIDNTISTWRR